MGKSFGLVVVANAEGEVGGGVWWKEEQNVELKV